MKASDWIKVEDRLPEVVEQVLIAIHDEQGKRHCVIGYLAMYNGEYSWEDCYGCNWSLDSVDYWMPIVLPKED